MHNQLVFILLLSTFASHAHSIRAGLPEVKPTTSVTEGALDSVNELGLRPLIDCIEKSLKPPIEWQTYPVLRLINMLENNQLDISFPLAFNTIRDQRAHRSSYVYEGSDSWIAQNPSLDMTDLTLDIGVIRGSAQHSKLFDLHYKNIYLANDHGKLFSLLLAGKLKLIVVSKLILDKYKLDHPKVNLTVHQQTGFKVGFYLSPKFHSQHAATFNAAVTECRHLFKNE